MPPRHRSFYRQFRAVWLVAVPVCLALACSLSPGGTPPPAGAATAAATSSPTTAAAGATAGPVEVIIGPGPFSLPDLDVGLDRLASYAATLRLDFAGTQDGQALTWSQTYTLRVATAPAARQVSVEREGNPAAALFLAELNGIAYERRGQQTCTATPLEVEAALLDRFVPVTLLTPVIGAEAAGQETVNGLAVAHYTFDERALGQANLTQSTGELWVAAEGGYVVKYEVTSAGEADFFGEGVAGTLRYSYALITPAEPLPLPADCPPGYVPAPLLPDAANVVNLPGLLSFATAAPLAEAVAFYNAQLPATGWTPLTAPILTDSTALLDFAQGAQQLTVIVTSAPGGTSVRLVLVRAVPPP